MSADSAERGLWLHSMHIVDAMLAVHFHNCTVYGILSRIFFFWGVTCVVFLILLTTATNGIDINLLCLSPSLSLLFLPFSLSFSLQYHQWVGVKW